MCALARKSFSRSYFTIKVILLVVSWLPCFSLGAFFKGETQYLERGHQGVVPCPSLSGARLTPEEVHATYWHRGPIDDTSAVVINYYGDIRPGLGVLPGLYNITEDLSLVINQVLDSTAGTYYCRLAPIKIELQDSSVPVRVIVSPRVDFPEVAPFDKKPRPNQCDVSIPADQSRINLTCTVEHAYPQISLELSSLQDTAGYRQQWVQLTDNEINIHRVIVSPQNNLSELDRPGRTSVLLHDVDVGEANPIKQHPYRLNPHKLQSIRDEVEYMLDIGIISPSQSPWSSPVLLVPKEDGSQRFCIDYRKVNSATKTDSFPIPRLDDCIDKIGHATFVSKYDLLKGYWQVPLTKRAQEISAFTTPDGLWSCNVMPFGMKNAPSTFTRLMSKVTGKIEGCVVYIDDVVIYSDSWQEHVQRTKSLFDKLSEAKLTVNLKKSEIGKASVTYLGHQVGSGKILPKAAKVQTINNLSPPQNKKEVMRFLGMTGFSRRFCPNFSTVAQPLTNLLAKNVKFVWSASCQVAFERLKEILTNEPVLMIADFERPFKMAIDASDVGVGAVLFQEDIQGLEHPVSYFSRKLNTHQKRYSTIEKETLGLILAIEHFEIYVTGPFPVTVYTDHNPLVYINKFKNKSQRLMRWSLFLQGYDIEYRHIPGKDNVIADYLSRSS